MQLFNCLSVQRERQTDRQTETDRDRERPNPADRAGLDKALMGNNFDHNYFQKNQVTLGLLFYVLSLSLPPSPPPPPPLLPLSPGSSSPPADTQPMPDFLAFSVAKSMSIRLSVSSPPPHPPTPRILPVLPPLSLSVSVSLCLCLSVSLPHPPSYPPPPPFSRYLSPPLHLQAVTSYLLPTPSQCRTA